MSVHKVEGARGPTFEVRWRPVSGPQKSRRFKEPDLAEGFDKAVRARVALLRADGKWKSCPAAARKAVLEWEQEHGLDQTNGR